MQKMKDISHHYFRPFFRFLHFTAFHTKVGIRTQNLKGFYGLFFCGINKTLNSQEMRKVYSECFVFHCVFHRKHCECKMREVYRGPNMYPAITGGREEVCNSPAEI